MCFYISFITFTDLLRKLKLLKYFKVDNALIQAASSCQSRKVILTKVYFLMPSFDKKCHK